MKRMTTLVWTAALVLLAMACAGPAAAGSWFSYVDARYGWYAGGLDARARLWRTSDGGKTLKLLPASYIGAGGGNAGVCFFDRKVGIWYGDFEYSMLRTTDGGLHWNTVTWPSMAVADEVAFSDPTHGWASCYIPAFPPEGGEIARTSDAGKTWTTARVLENADCGGLASPTPACCYAKVYRSDWTWELWRTVDGGGTWAERALPGGAGEQLGSMVFPSVSTGWFIVGEAIYKTTDGGRRWTRQTTGGRRALYDLEFVDSRYGWAVGARGTILATRDGGAHWRPQSSGTKAGLGSVDFIDRLHGWAGDSRVRLRTSDGGKTWRRL